MFRINVVVRRDIDGARFKLWDAKSVRSHELPNGSTCVHAVLKDGRDLAFFGEIESVTSNRTAPYC
ncbi:hypothetical protein LCGC14_1820040 [marine sediment metagenome]|uniref:Uncharacterized protein n=1 Tax=marine sediment metagenome TaxID=412755 RepID=A0A0F9GJC3_9ZZZZ